MTKSKNKSAHGVAGKPVQTGQTGPLQLMTKTHYSFAESLRFIKSEFQGFTRENLLNHGFQGDVDFLVRVPPGISIRSSHPSAQQNLQERTPHFLSLQADDCETIERDGLVHLYAFAKGYWISSARQLVEVLPNYQSHGEFSGAWYTFQNDISTVIPISSQDLAITHLKLLLLVLRIKLRLEGNITPSEQRIFINQAAADLTTKHFQSLQTISNASNISVLDFLRHAIQRDLPLCIFVPPEVIVRSSSNDDFNSRVEYLRRPQFLELSKEHCLSLYKEECTTINQFPAGYIVDANRDIHRIIPQQERSGLPNTTSWTTCNAGMHIWQTVSHKDLYARASDVPELLEPPSQYDFKFSQAALKKLSCDGYIDLEQVISLLKLNHPDCAINHLLQLSQSDQLDFFTLAPAGIQIKKSDHVVDNDSSVNDLPRLIVDKITCTTIQIHGEALAHKFPRNGIITYAAAYGPKGKVVERTASLKTYYRGKPHPIKINADCLYVHRDQVLNLIDYSHDFWDEIILAAAKNSTPKHDGDPTLNGTLTSLRESSLPGNFLGGTAVVKRLKISPTALRYKTDETHERHDKEFPQPVRQEGRPPKWKESAIEAYALAHPDKYPASPGT